MWYKTDSQGHLVKIAGNGNGIYGGNALPVGSIFASALPMTSNRYHLLNGDSLSFEGIYSSFYNTLNELVDAQYRVSCTADEYAESLAKTGNCGKFCINKTSTTLVGTYTSGVDTYTVEIPAKSFKLPTITTFIEGITSITQIGSTLEAGLPNITGNVVLIEPKSSWSSSNYNTGPFKTGSQWNVIDISSSRYDGYGTGTFDASRANSIYGNSDTVQPISTRYPYYIVLLSGSVQPSPTPVAGVTSIGNQTGDILLGDGIGIDGSTLNTNKYSTGETICGTWIDGNPIYRKVVPVPGNYSIPIGSEANLSVAQSDLPTNVSRYINAICITYDSESSLTTACFGTVLVKNINYANSTIAVRNVGIGSYVIIATNTTYVVLEYTKTVESNGGQEEE